MKIITVGPSTPAWTRKSEGDSIELSDGRLMLAYMEFSGDGSDIAATRIVAVDSADGGETWTNHRVLAVTEPGEMNVFSPNFLRGLDGSILFIFMRQVDVPGKAPSGTQVALKSTDEGRTFKAFAKFAVDEPLGLCNGVAQRLASGRILLPVMHTTMIGKEHWELYGQGVILYSDDDAKTWSQSPARVVLPMRGVMEPHVEQAADGRVVMVMRTQLGSVFTSESHDEGVTWSLPQTTGLHAPESCPVICKIPSTGDLLLIWNHSLYNPGASHFGRRSPLTAAVSRDGKTWSHIRDIETDIRRAFSNPGCRFTRDGRAIVNYWTCEYLPNDHMQGVIDQRVAIIPTGWFYGKE